MQQSSEDRQQEIKRLSKELSERTRRATRISVLVSILLSVIAATWLVFSFLAVASLEKRKQALSEDIKELRNLQDDLLNDLGWSRERLDSSTTLADDVRASLQASDARRTAAAQSSPGARERTTITVFSRDVDRDIVANSLRELGFRVDIGSPNPAIRPATETNAIWFGPEVGIDQVKLVAYTLIMAGVELRVIEPFQRPRGRDRVMQVGSQVGGLMRPLPFSIEEIQAADTFN